MTGDQAALDQAAVAIRANLDRLKTWSGLTKIVTRSLRQNQTRVRFEYSANFLVDFEGDEYWYYVTADSATDEQTGVPLDVQPRAEGGMSHQRLFVKQRMIPEARTTLEYRPKESVAWKRMELQPKSFFKFEGVDQDLYLKRLDWTFHDQLASGNVSKDKDRVVVTYEDAGLRQSRAYSLAHGGNLTHFESLESSEESRTEFQYTWEWAEVNHVFVPSKITQSRKFFAQGKAEPADESETVITFTQHEVNAPLPADAFGLKHLKLQAGDKIQDARHDKKYLTVTAVDERKGLQLVE